MKFKQRAFKMRVINQETLDKICLRISDGYNSQLLPDILKIMSQWAVQTNKIQFKENN
jgi:hypothetical protein